MLSIAAVLCTAEETSFQHIKVVDAKGRENKAVLVFSDNDKAVEVRPAKGNAVSIPYAAIDKFSYEFTKHHRVNEGTVLTAPIGVGAVAMLTKSRSHWLEIDYQDQDLPKSYVLRMDKKNYIHILDAIKAHTGKDTEILGNANKR
ncbi:MAG: hypothetical protein WA485_10985 [Candidatus Sulfotelmatobacter sp.]